MWKWGLQSLDSHQFLELKTMYCLNMLLDLYYQELSLTDTAEQKERLFVVNEMTW